MCFVDLLVVSHVPMDILPLLVRLLTDLHEERSDSKPFWA